MEAHLPREWCSPAHSTIRVVKKKYKYVQGNKNHPVTVRPQPIRSTMVEALGLCHLLRHRNHGRGRVERRLSHCLGRSFGCAVGPEVGLKAGVALGFGLVVIGLELELGPELGPGPGPGFEAEPDRTGLDVHCCSFAGPVLAVESEVAPLELAGVVQGWKSGGGCSQVNRKRIDSYQSWRE